MYECSLSTNLSCLGDLALNFQGLIAAVVICFRDSLYIGFQPFFGLKWEVNPQVEKFNGWTWWLPCTLRTSKKVNEADGNCTDTWTSTKLKKMPWHVIIHVVFEANVSKISRQRYVHHFFYLPQKKQVQNGFRNFPGLDSEWWWCLCPRCWRSWSRYIYHHWWRHHLYWPLETLGVLPKHQWMRPCFGIIISSVQPVTGWWF